MNAPATHDAHLVDAELLAAVTRMCQIARRVTGGWDYRNNCIVQPESFMQAACSMASLSSACGQVEEMLRKRK